MPVLCWWFWTKTELLGGVFFWSRVCPCIAEDRGVSSFECSQAIKVDFEMRNRFLDGLATVEEKLALLSHDRLLKIWNRVPAMRRKNAGRFFPVKEAEKRSVLRGLHEAYLYAL